ncbi:hypothetical protein X760_30685 [Mesorhizobium sp. LSHC422A00]|nr:hypothetical protein [Mesorhizobium sp. L2C089B000]ESX52785.1 hypothetical protein X760_30685 [Mesorhizobium sp. LSHC422A00]ESZ07239.1 hypothetical protein X736_12940 [Mesorhizobium sp. L2C089B000]
MKALRAVDSQQMLVTVPMMITVSTRPAPRMLRNTVSSCVLWKAS